MWALLLGLSLGHAEPWEFRAEVGGEFDADPNGILNVAWRKDDLSLAWLTDTLDVRYQPGWSKGRAWVAVRAELAMARLSNNRWEDGAPSRAQSFLSFYEGVEGGGVVYLPAGFYVGAQATARYWHFVGLPTTERELPSARPVLTLEGLAGFYHPALHAWVRAGTDWSLGFQPHVHGTITTSLPGIVRPVVEVRAGWGQNKDEVTTTLIGGLNPYVVPLAGASWAEFQAEDYAGVRAGVEGGPDRWNVGFTWDGVWFDGNGAAGLALHGGYADRGRWVKVSVGWAPWLERQQGPALAGFVLFGVDWGQGFGPRQ